MPDKKKRKSRRERLIENPPHPSTRGDRGKSVVGKLCENCPELLHEIAALRYNGEWLQHREERNGHISLRRHLLNKNCGQRERVLEDGEEIDTVHVRETARGAEVKITSLELYSSSVAPERPNNTPNESEELLGAVSEGPTEPLVDGSKRD